jgi:uncharacterized membrane protein
MTIHRNERIMAYAVAAIIALSIIAFFAIIIGTASGMKQADFGVGLWPAIAVLPLIGLPIGLLLIIILIIVSMVRRSRAARDSRH